MMPKDRPVRVGFVIDSLRLGAGTENQLILLLQRMDPKRVTPFLCCLRHLEPRSLQIGDCPVFILHLQKLASFKGLIGILDIRNWVRSRNLDLVITFFRDANIVGTIGSWLGRVPVVSSRRNLGRGYWHTRSELILLRLLNRVTFWHVANSVAVRDYTVSAEGVSPDRISVLPNAVDLTEFRPRTDQHCARTSRSKLALPSGFLVVCVANLRPIKGLDVLLQAFADSEFLRSRCHLLLIGSGESEIALRKLAGECSLEHCVYFLGSRSDVAEILRAADLAVLPSRGESLSNAIIEYLASGLPVVATDVGGTREILAGGECGVLVPPADPRALRSAIEALVQDTGLRIALGQSGRARAEALYAAGVVVDEWVKFFEEKAGKCGDRRRSSEA